jgi:hypothetical protein
MYHRTFVLLSFRSTSSHTSIHHGTHEQETNRPRRAHASAKIQQHCPMNTHGGTPHTNRNREMAALTSRGSPRTDVRVESANVRVEGAEVRVESADVRVEGAGVGGGIGRRRRGAGVTGRDEVDLKVRVPRRRRRRRLAVAARESAAGVRVEGVRHHRRLGFPHPSRCGDGEEAAGLSLRSLLYRARAGTQTHSALSLPTPINRFFLTFN